VYNASALLPLVLGLITSSLSGRVTLMWARSGDFHEIDARRHVVWSVIGALAFPAQVALGVCAFFVLWWPLSIALLLACLVLFGVLFGLMLMWSHQTLLVPLTAAQPMLNLITVAAAVAVVWMLIG
jgi:hypothetical protein